MSTTAQSPFRGIDVHPATHPPTALATRVFDVVVLGGGPAGRTLAHDTAAAGLATLLVEAELVAGECAFWACIPSKALLRPGEVLAEARSVEGARQRVDTSAPVDIAAVFARRDAAVRKWIDHIPIAMAEEAGVAVARGRGHLLDERVVGIAGSNGEEEVRITARKAVVLATGSVSAVPDIPGLRDVEMWTPREATAANRVPQHLVILGGGVVGCEMATFYGSVGKVTLVSSGKDLLPRMEPEASSRTRQALIDKGVDVRTSTRIQSFQPRDKDNFDAKLSTGETITATTVLVAAGRKANLEGIGLERMNLTDFRQTPVDDHLCVPGMDWLYAIGDVNERSPLTHMGVYQGHAAAKTIIARSDGKSIGAQAFDAYSATADNSMTPQVVVTDPPVASVGLTLAQARAQGVQAKEVAVKFSSVAAASLHAESSNEGWAQWVVDAQRGVLVGATMVGPRAGELLHASTVAIVGAVPVARLRHAVASFPTLSEVYTSLLVASGY